MFDIAKGTIRLRSEMSKNAEERVLMVVGQIAEIIDRRRAERKDLMRCGSALVLMQEGPAK
jgi:hypothetical protein